MVNIKDIINSIHVVAGKNGEGMISIEKGEPNEKVKATPDETDLMLDYLEKAIAEAKLLVNIKPR
tara:strand:- start:44 stop:238 length:195 start_codon:yes stop_codon:yes gene_type:complete